MKEFTKGLFFGRMGGPTGSTCIVKTMTVGELQDFLNAYPKDMPVMATWEGVAAMIEPENFSVVSGFHKGFEEEACDCLVVDVEGY
jgi:hypothetical protein